jgi:hypothetical protein
MVGETWGDYIFVERCRIFCGNLLLRFCRCKIGDEGNPWSFQQENMDLHISLFCHCCMDLNDEPKKTSEELEVERA